VSDGVWVGWLVDLLIVCFDFILHLCIFLNNMRCQNLSGRQKPHGFCQDRIVGALYDPNIYVDLS
jgi:hypothetical protein